MEEEELQYTSIEPDRETAQKELRRITEELQKQEEEEPEAVVTNYETLQEENAIISMDELMAKGKAMYDANELTQYVEEGNEPISLSELEKQYGREASPLSDTFEIEKVVSDEELETEKEVKEVKPVVVETEKKFKRFCLY